jgi:hypothetical protein
VPRILRRGMPYGPPLESDDDDGVDRGVFGIFIGSDLRRQLYTLATWIKRNDFSPVFDGNRRTQDALMGNRAYAGADTSFTIPRDTGDLTIAGLPDFISTKGTAFLLYPSGTTLKRLTKPSRRRQEAKR